MKFQFCCGEHEIPGWENFDTDCDITRPLPFGDGCAEMILCEHGLEHFDAPTSLRFLMECYRMLEPGGTIRICCPVIKDEMKLEHARDLVFGHGHRQLLTPRSLLLFLRLAGFNNGNTFQTPRKDDIDGHWKIIGKEKDDLETCRLEAFK